MVLMMILMMILILISIGWRGGDKDYGPALVRLKPWPRWEDQRAKKCLKVAVLAKRHQSMRKKTIQDEQKANAKMERRSTISGGKKD